MHGFIHDIGIAFLVATVVGLVAQKIGQPIVLGYFLAGVIIGPEIGPPLISDPANIEVIAEIGLVLLLFVIGLEMDVPKIARSGRQMLIAGVGQFVLCVSYGIAVFGFLGYSLRGADLSGLYLSLLCGLSSTAIVVKLLYDKMELDTLHGRLSVGVLVMQDIWAVMILAFQPNFNNPEFGLFAVALFKCALLIGLSYLLSKHLMSRLFQAIAKSPEMVIITSLGWCTLVAGLAGMLGLSREMGALIAGVTVSAFPYSIFVCAKVLPLRDFFLTLFFVTLGMKIPYPTVSILGTALFLTLFIPATRFLSVYPVLKLTGAGRRTAFIASLNLSQLSEFSLVIATLGLSYHHLEKEMLGVFIYTMAFSAIFSSYLILYSHSIFFRAEPWLARWMPSDKSMESPDATEKKAYPIVILGFHRGAKAFIEEMAVDDPEVLKKILVIDFNIETLKEIRAQNIGAVYGDVSHLDTLEHSNIESAQIILSTIPDMLLKGTNNTTLVKLCRSLNPTAFIVATADFSGQRRALLNMGANEVLLPYSMAGRHLVPIVKNNLHA